MDTIGLRELNQNPSKALARVRAGVTVRVTDRGKPVFRMVPEESPQDALARMLGDGTAHPPIEFGMPEIAVDLAGETPSLSGLMVDERARERAR